MNNSQATKTREKVFFLNSKRPPNQRLRNRKDKKLPQTSRLKAGLVPLRKIK